MFNVFRVIITLIGICMYDKIIEAKVTGGSADNGIDGIIEIIDDLNKTTRILIQAKVRTKFVTLKEVREFYGAFKSEKADVGIFITNATYHKEAQKFSKNLNDLVLIDDVTNRKEILFSGNYACPECNISFEELSPRMFSFNNPFGACPDCSGLGFLQTIDESKIIRNANNE